jgi:hypothetical protein
MHFCPANSQNFLTLLMVSRKVLGYTINIFDNTKIYQYEKVLC